MDIVLFCRPGWLVVIENKVDAGEAAQQLTRYTKWLDKQQGYNQKKLIFLTPTGHESVTANAGDYLQLSYLDLAEAFSLFLDQDQIKAESVRIVLTQYITICKLIAGMDMAIQDKQLVELLKEPDNIRIALEIEQQTQFIRSQIVKEFGEHIQKILQRKLESTNLEKIWKAPGSRYFCESFYGHPCPTSGKSYATANACGCPSRPASFVGYPTRGIQHHSRNDSTRCRKACIFTTQKALRENTCPIASGDYSTPVSQRMLNSIVTIL